MNRVATCPKCKTGYELDEDDIGHLMECECGAALFACHTRSLNVFDLFCGYCGSQHPVRGADVGNLVEVDCGRTVRVPDVMLRLPVGDQKLASRASAEWQRHQQGSPVESRRRQPVAYPPPLTQTADGTPPRTSTRVEKITDADRNTGVGKNKHLGKDTTGDGADPSTTEADGNSSACLGTAKNQMAVGVAGNREVKKPAAARRHLGSMLGGVAVAAFLIAAVVMFLLREPPSKKRANRSANVNRSAPSKGMQSGAAPELQTRAVIAGVGLSVASEDLGVSGLPTTQVTSAQAVAGADDAGKSGSYRLPAPTIYALPAKKQPRDRIAVQKSKTSFSDLQSAMKTVFDKYGRVQKLKEQADDSGLQEDVDAYQQAIGRTIGVIEQVQQFAVNKSAEKETATTRYLLAFLYLKAGMLPEAAVMGEAVVRWGDIADPSTKEAGMIALAATQELCDLHWGVAEGLGEVRLMENVADVLRRRWPKDGQNDLIVMNIAYLYEAFNQPRNAVRVYKKISDSSERYGTATLASGMAEWNVLRQQQLASGKPIVPEDRKRVKQQIAKGLRLVEKKDSTLTLSGVEARLALAQIDLIGGNPEKSEEWLTVNSPALLSTICVREDDNAGSRLLVDEITVRQLYEVLFHARNQQGDTKGATQAIEDLAQIVGDAGEDLASRRISILKVTFQNLKQSDEINKAEFESARELSNGIMEDASSVPTTTILWLGESWAQVGEQTQASDKAGPGNQEAGSQFAEDAARLAAGLFDLAIKRNDFPQESLQAAQLRRIELLRRSGEVMQSLKQIEDMLANEPNVFTLQIAAAQCLQQVAVEYQRSSDLLAAIEGPSGFSPIWGWGKLVTTLHTTVYSAAGTPRHAEQLALAQYNLFWCRYQLAMQIKDRVEQTRQLTEVQQMLGRRIATMDKKSEWYSRYNNLLDQISAGS